jgi:hypothetical protein
MRTGEVQDSWDPMTLGAGLLAEVHATPNLGVAALLSSMALMPTRKPDTLLMEGCASLVAL